jgi:hypothetical protein
VLQCKVRLHCGDKKLKLENTEKKQTRSKPGQSGNPSGKKAPVKKKSKPTRTKAAIQAANGPARSYTYTQAIADAICERLADGDSLTAICKSPGFPGDATVRRWAGDNEHPFAAEYARARSIGYHKMAEEILAIADDGRRDYRANEDGAVVVDHDHIARSRLRVETRKWVLSKMLPKIYGDSIKVGGDPEAPIQHHHSAVSWMTKEEAVSRGWA